MEKTILVVAVVALIFVSAFCVSSFAILIQREEEQRDPATGYDPPPGESYSYAYQYGEYDPITKKYYNIQQEWDWDWKPNTGDYVGDKDTSKDQFHPYVRVWVIYFPEVGDPFVDTSTRIEW